MALLVTADYTTYIGTVVPSTYWRWTQLNINVVTMTANVILQGYVSEAAFNAGASHINQRAFTITGNELATLVLAAPDGPTLTDAISNAIYDYAIANDLYFATAVDPALEVPI